MLRADLPHALPITGRRRETATCVLHRLQKHRCNGVRALRFNRERDLFGCPTAKRLGIAPVQEAGSEVRRSIQIRIRHPERGGHQRLKLLLEFGDAGDRESALSGAVIRDLARNHLVLHGFASELEVVLREFPRGLNCLGAARGEEHPVDVPGRGDGEPLRELDRARVGVRPDGVEGELFRLSRRSVGQFVATVPHLGDVEARQSVEIPPASGVEDVRALAPHDDGNVGVRPARMVREVHPQVIVRGSLERGVVHDNSS